MVSFSQLENGAERICVVGLGYVGLPLAVRLASKFKVIGFDIDAQRVSELQGNQDHTGEIEAAELEASSAEFTTDPAAIKGSTIVIVTVPTPIDDTSRPDLRPILGASRTVGENLAKGAIVVYESTVYPGLTEEECVPILEECSGLKWKEDFHVGYSPERINPGDKVHTVDKITKVVSGDSPESAKILGEIYGSIITAGIHLAPSIKVAEAAKVIENTQRDLNIALMNELSLIFGRLDIPTDDILAAAGTKWNFLPFTPGLVGGHCIGVDPYYLTHKAESVGYQPQVILAGRRINDGMGKYVAEQTIKQLIHAGHGVRDAKILVLGLTFKENVPDLRNTRVIDIIEELKDYGVQIDVHDPHASADEAKAEYDINLVEDLNQGPYNAVILAVKHDAYKDLGIDGVANLSTDSPVLIDIKWLFSPDETSERGMLHWRL